MAKKHAPFGTWKSPITAGVMAAKGNRPSFPRFFDNALFWMEHRPEDNARTLIFRQDDHGNIKCLTPDTYSAHTRAHEYGGICYTVGNNNLFFVNASNQQIYRQNLTNLDEIEPLTQAALDTDDATQKRFADLIYDRSRDRIIAVTETHTASDTEPVARIEAIGVASGVCEILVEGADFYAHPRLSPDDNKLLWLEWFHPNMPWDETRLLLGYLRDAGEISRITSIDEGGESIFQPEWYGDNEILFVSDKNNFWNLYRVDPTSRRSRPIFEAERDCGLPLWQFGMSTWGFISASEIIVAHCLGGDWQLALVNIETTEHRSISTPGFNYFNDLCTDPNSGRTALIASGPTCAPVLCSLAKFALAPITKASGLPLKAEDISAPQAFSFPTSNGDECHGYFYSPANSAYHSDDGELPPLILLCHGGPTGSTSAALNIKIQFWTSRGFAVADINYRGSTGYGRAYRDKLKGNWGIYDVEDACEAANYAVAKGWADPSRLIIRGSSAGGYTVLCALCFHDTFSAGCSLYGIGDLQALATDTHKFESRYTDTLIAPADQTEIYQARSPIEHIDNFSCPTIFFQGLEDRVVPPDQAESMVEALASKNIPVAYVTYADEGHGFKQPANIVHAFNTELAFYGRVFGFDTDAVVDDLVVRNMEIS